MVASLWRGDGELAAFDAATRNLLPGRIKLVANAAVDLNAATRIGYSASRIGDGLNTRLRALARMKISNDDWFFAHAPAYGGKLNNDITALMVIARANEMPKNPTIFDIWAAGLNSGLSSVSPNNIANGFEGDHIDKDFTFAGSEGVLTHNTKYWAMLVPVQMVIGANINTAKFLYSANGSNNWLARAVSFWTNRTPAAPVIEEPIPNSIVASGSVVNLTISPNADPDFEFGNASDLGYIDRAGVQVQYAPRPSQANPNPTWIDLPFADFGSGVLRSRGWWIASSKYIEGAFEAPYLLAQNGTVEIRCGTNTPLAGAGLLPSGAWQLRVRQFDFGHSYPVRYGPLSRGLYPSGDNAFKISGGTGNFSPTNYPATNTSPWSDPVYITVSAQVPSPVPLYPINNAAIVDGAVTTLTWQYRNTAVPPYAQGRRTVAIRRVGDSAWTLLADNQLSGSSALIVDEGVFPLVSGNPYEWRVMVVDANGVSSTWSESATFWVVPAPSSGGTRPLPSDTTDGASLGCGTHRVEVFRRGGKVRVAELKNFVHLDWNRVRDDISTAQVTIADWDVDCGELLSRLECWAYELVITRDNGYSQDRVWEGPITLLTYAADRVVIDAKDVMAYAYRRIVKQAMSDRKTGDTVVSRAARVLQNVFGPDDPNVLGYLTVLSREDDAMQYRVMPEYSRTAFEEIDDMAANAGLDYTAIGRAILIWGTKHRIGTLPEFRDADLGASPIVSEYGMSMANRYVVSDGNGIWGEATRLDENGEDPKHGLVEMLSSTWASDSEPEDGTYTQAGLDKVRAGFAEGSERSIASRFPNPVVVRVPDNTSLSPDTVISIQHLVPGVVVPLRSTSTLRTVVANQKLDSIKVVEEKGVETITITLSPFSRDDGAAEGEATE